MTALILASLLAAAQDGTDAHGFPTAAQDGDLHDPILGWRPEAQRPGAIGLSLLGEYASQPLAVFHQTRTDVLRETLLGDVAGATIGVHAAVHRRVAVALTAPLWLTASGTAGQGGPALGDLRLAAPVGLLLPGDDGGLGLSVVPFVDLPTGPRERFLGAGGVGGGALIAAGFDAGILGLTANLGVGTRPASDFENLQAGPYSVASLAAAVGLGTSHSVGLEAMVRPRLARNEIAGTETPGEATLFVRGRYPMGLHWVVGAATALTPGAGASPLRIYAGVGFTFNDHGPRDRDGDGILDRDDSCPDDREVVNQYKDQDGCPDALAGVALHVVGGDGKPLADAAVTLGATSASTPPSGEVDLADQMPETRVQATASHPFTQDGALDIGPLKEGANDATLKLAWKPGTVEIVARTTDGIPVAAAATLRGSSAIPVQDLGDDGRVEVRVPPGAWTVFVEAGGFGTAQREVVLEPAEDGRVLVELTLEPARVKVATTEVLILEAVHFDFDQATLQARSIPLLTEVATTLSAHPELLEIEIGGHTDAQGSDAYNLDLSSRRVATVRAFLIDHGVAASRLTARGYGESHLLDPADTAAAHAKNRRVEFQITRKAEGAP